MKEKKPINLEIGQNVKQIRENAGLTQERLAELIGPWCKAPFGH